MTNEVGDGTTASVPFRGVFPILPTPFDSDGKVDMEGVERIAEFSVRFNAHGVVTTANASEAPYLNDNERNAVVRRIIQVVDGRVPVIVGVTASCAPIAIEYAAVARDAGATGLMAMPPFLQKATEQEIVSYYRMIAKAVRLPLFIQNYSGPGGTPMSVGTIQKIIDAIDEPVYVKEETDFPGVVITGLLERADPRLLGVMGGKAGRQLPDEYRRGACGTMPACEVTDLHVKLWNALESGDHSLSRQLYQTMLPLLLFEVNYGVAVYKEVLRRRQVINNAAFRQAGGKQLDPAALIELDEIMSGLEGYLEPVNL